MLRSSGYLPPKDRRQDRNSIHFRTFSKLERPTICSNFPIGYILILTGQVFQMSAPIIPD